MYENPQPIPHNRFANNASVRAKVEQDIGFLSDRIAALKMQSDPNQVVIDTYQTMLDSRLSVLKWLEGERPRRADEARPASA